METYIETEVSGNVKNVQWWGENDGWYVKVDRASVTIAHKITNKKLGCFRINMILGTIFVNYDATTYPFIHGWGGEYF